MTTDLFQHYDQWPQELADVLNKYFEESEELNYQQLADMLKECEAIGYTFDYYLDATPFNLKKIESWKST
jgi:hypothetical protein